jgi:tRNA threonylcarbamoyladenosine biosynthesis protein TsaE
MDNSPAIIAKTPDDTFAAGEKLAGELRAGDAVLLSGGLGAGKTLLTKGILHALGYDVDEVTSPSFALVNLYHAPNFNVYHIDLWRLEPGADIGMIVGLDELSEGDNNILIIEWADRLQGFRFHHEPIRVFIDGDGDEPRRISIPR